MSLRLRAATDATQVEISRVLRLAGFSVQSLHRTGGGVPDLLVGRGGINWLLELKMPANLRGDPKPLTPDQVIWHRDWRGQVAIVVTAEDALRAVGVIR